MLGLPIPVDYRPTDGELDNICYLTMKYTIQWPMRQADLAVCILMAGGKEAIVGDAGLSKYVHEICAYLWDHIAGEPDEFTADTLFEHIKPILNQWWAGTTVEERSNTATENG